MNSEQEAALAEMEDFKEKMKDHGKTTEHAFWNMTATIFGLVLSAASVISTINPDFSKPVLFGTMYACCLGLFLIWRCFKKQREFYSLMVISAQRAIEAKRADDMYAAAKEILGKIGNQIWAEKYANMLFGISLLGLVLMVVV